MRAWALVPLAAFGLVLLATGGEPAPRGGASLDRSRDTVHALAVFVRFPDDDGASAEWPNRDASGRPISPRQLPPFGVGLFESDPERVRAETLTLGDSSLSAYFYWQSRHGPRGPHILTGDVWPRDRRGRPVVYVPRHGNAHYTDAVVDGRVQDTGVGYGALVTEILDALVAQPGFDIADYDVDADGVLDHLFVVVRRDLAMGGAGVLSLAGNQRTRGRFSTLAYASPTGRTVRVREHSGSIVWIAEVPPRASLIHEYGHDLFEMNHTRILESNDVPLNVPPEGQTGHAACRFSAMCGTNASPRRSNYDQVPSLGSYERIRMGWADVRTLRAGDGRARDAAPQALTIGPLFTTGRVYEVPLADGSAADVLRLESRQRVGYFNRHPSTFVPAPGGGAEPYYGTIWRDLAATGLLVTLSSGDPDGPARRYLYDVVPPSNTHLVSKTRCSGVPEACTGYDRDRHMLYRPGVATQITPWTRPNVSGYTRYPDGRAPNWFAIDRIRYTGDADSTMAFDFVADVRRAPEIVIRDDSWMGAETSGTTFRQPVRVAPGATLTVEAPARVAFAGGLAVEEAGRFVCERGAVCRR